MLAAMRSYASWRGAAAVGLAALVVLLVLGSAVPDPSQLSADAIAELELERPVTLAIARRVPLGRILGSPWLLALPAALGTAIAWNLGRRLRAWSTMRDAVQADPAAQAAMRFHSQLEFDVERPPLEVVPRLSASFQREGWSVGTAPEGLVARRGRVGFWGSVTFHAALVLLLAAIGVSMAAAWQAELLVAEGQDVALDDASAVRVVRKAPLASPAPHAVVALTRFAPRFTDEGFPLDYRAEIVALDSAGRIHRAALRVNEPFEVDGRRLYLMRYGMAPFFEVREGDRLLARAPVSLTVIGGREDAFEVPGTAIRIAARYLGDPVRRGRRYASRTDVPRNPAFELRRLDAPAGARPALLRRGEEATLGSLRVAFPELRYWIVLGVDRDPGAPILFVALALAALGLAIRFWDHDHEIRVRVEPRGAGSRVAASVRSRYFPVLMRRELDALRRRA